MFGLGQLMMPEMRPFNVRYRCYSAAVMGDRRDVEHGGKIILPSSALDYLTRLNIAYPMMFKLTNIDPNKTRITHCGVLEFVAPEGQCCLPHWMMRNLLLNEGDLVQVENVALPVATYVKFRPCSVEFLNISNPRAVLEVHLRHFACLTKGDVIAMEYINKTFELQVLDVKPGNAVSIIECDVNLEFDQPVDYVEPERSTKPKQPEQPEIVIPEQEPKGFVPFRGEGRRLDGRQRKTTEPLDEAKVPIARGVPNYEYQPGMLHFLRVTRPKIEPVEAVKQKEAFSGEGRKLREKKT